MIGAKPSPAATPPDAVAEKPAAASRMLTTPEIVRLTEKYRDEPDPTRAERIKEEIIKGFYGR